VSDALLEIIAQGAWNGGTPVDNSVYENMGMFFKGAIPVNHETIEHRIGVRTRMAAPTDERIGVTAFQDLLKTSGIDPSRIRVLISATNIGEDKLDPGPVCRYTYELVRRSCSQALVFDLYAGCPGFNVSVEVLHVLAMTGALKPGDLSIIVGAENLHRARPFKPLDTANIIFGDDALATALETRGEVLRPDNRARQRSISLNAGEDFVTRIAEGILTLCGKAGVDGIIVDNHLGKLLYRVPATAARVQHRLTELLYPEEEASGTFRQFKDALAFYDRNVRSFAYDIMSLERTPRTVNRIAGAYVGSGKSRRVASVYLPSDFQVEITLHEGEGIPCARPRKGVLDTLTRTHGCFTGYIEAVPHDEDVFGFMDGKGVFLHATRGARAHLSELLGRNGLRLEDVELLFEHQANFAMIPLTLEQLLGNGLRDSRRQAADFIARKMVCNIHLRGNCSVVCMQRLPYDLERGSLEPDTVQGFAVNRQVVALQEALLILYDSVGAGMTRSSFLRRR
jgi:3-oxoacyl-[acyl-carrier-protein] synthase III